jgi:hypothetical protein
VAKLLCGRGSVPQVPSREIFLRFLLSFRWTFRLLLETALALSPPEEEVVFSSRRHRSFHNEEAQSIDDTHTDKAPGKYRNSGRSTNDKVSILDEPSVTPTAAQTEPVVLAGSRACTRHICYCGRTRSLQRQLERQEWAEL